MLSVFSSRLATTSRLSRTSWWTDNLVGRPTFSAFFPFLSTTSPISTNNMPEHRHSDRSYKLDPRYHNTEQQGGTIVPAGTMYTPSCCFAILNQRPQPEADNSHRQSQNPSPVSGRVVHVNLKKTEHPTNKSQVMMPNPLLAPLLYRMVGVPPFGSFALIHNPKLVLNLTPQKSLPKPRRLEPSPMGPARPGSLVIQPLQVPTTPTG